MCGRRHPGHTNAAVSSTRLVLLWVWTGPHVLLWTLCSFWVSLRRRQGLSAAGRLQPVGGRVKISLPVPVGGGSLCLSLVPAVLPSLQPFASRRPRPFHLSPAFLGRSPLASPFSLSLTRPLQAPASCLLLQRFRQTASPLPLSSQCSTSLPRPVVRGSRSSFALQDDPPP